MKLRVISGSSPVSAATESGLSKLHATPALRIDGDARAWQIDLRDGRRAFVFGEVLGIRDADGGLTPLTSRRAVGDLLDREAVDRAAALLEGRVCLVVAGPGDRFAIATDRFGQHEVFYQRTPKGAAFASELDLLPIDPATEGYDQAALVHTLVVYGARPPKRHTIYRGVRRLGIGECASGAGGSLELVTAPFVPLPVRPYGRAELDIYADTLIDAVRVRGSADGNVVSLSSGWDSTAILACLVHLFGRGKVRGVIGRMRYASRSGVINRFEVERATAMAAHYGTQLDIAEYDYSTAGAEWLDRARPMMRSHMLGGPNGVGRSIWADRAATLAGRDQAVFAGEISDGAHNLGFAQYATILEHPVYAFREYSDKMASYLFGPTFLKQLHSGRFETDAVYRLLRDRAGAAVFDSPATPGPAATTGQLLASFFLRSHRLPLISLRSSRILTPAGLEAYQSEMETEYLREPAAAATPETLYAWYLHLYNSFHWQSSSVSGFSVISEEYGLRPRLPFWDSRLQEFLSAMPEDWGRGLELKPTKYPLKWMLEHRLDYPLHLQTGPHSYLYDVDASFSHAAELMYGSQLASRFRKGLESRRYRQLLSPDVFQLDLIDEMVGRYLEGTEVRGTELAELLSLATLSAVGWYGM